LHLIAHDQLELLETKAPLCIAQLPVPRDAEEVRVRNVQFRLERLQPRQNAVVSDHGSKYINAETAVFEVRFCERRSLCFCMVIDYLSICVQEFRTSFFIAAQNSWLVRPPDLLLSRTCRDHHNISLTCCTDQ
jgi:hypothetical protein